MLANCSQSGHLPTWLAIDSTVVVKNSPSFSGSFLFQNSSLWPPGHELQSCGSHLGSCQRANPTVYSLFFSEYPVACYVGSELYEKSVPIGAKFRNPPSACGGDRNFEDFSNLFESVNPHIVVLALIYSCSCKWVLPCQRQLEREMVSIRNAHD